MANELMTVENGENIIVNLEDGTREEYSIQKIPSATSSLVLNSKKAILQNINLDDLFNNLNRCVPLLNISYDALAGVGYTIKDSDKGITISGMSLSRAVESLRDSFSNTLDKSVVVMNNFEQGTSTAIKKFQTAYGALVNPAYKTNGVVVASTYLGEIKAIATKMHNAANNLSDEFNALENKAQSITQEVINENDKDIAVQEYTKNKIKSLTAKQEAFSKIKEDLDKEVQKYEEEYNKIYNQIEKNEKRAFGMALSSAIIGGITSIAGPIINAVSTTAAVSSVANNLISGGKEQATTQQQTDSSSSSTPSDNTQKTENDEKIKEYENSIKEYEAQISAINKQLEELGQQIKQLQEEFNNTTDEENKNKIEQQKKELLAKQDDLTIQKKNCEDKINEAKTKKDTVIQALKGVTEGLKESSEKLEQQAQKYEDKNDKLYEQLQKISQYKAEAEKAKREAHRELAEIAANIANSNTVVKDLSVVCESLVMAINSMRFVKIYLSDIAFFWKNVEEFCNKLSKEVQSLKTNVEIFKDVEDCIDVFKSADFITIYFINITYWVALHIVSLEYQEAFNKTRKDYQTSLLEHTAEVDHTVQWERARALAGQVLHELKA